MYWPNPLSPGKRKQLAQRLQKQFPDQIDAVIALVENSDPTPNGTYVIWIATLVSRGEIVLPDMTNQVREALEYFHQVKQHLVPELRNINEYRTFYQLSATLEAHRDVVSKRQAHKDAITHGQRVILSMDYDGSSYQLILVTTKEAAAELAKGTGWCVHHEDAAANYLAIGPLYFVRKNGKIYALFHYEKDEFKLLENHRAGREARLELKPLLDEFEVIAVESDQEAYLEDPTPEKLNQYLLRLSYVDGTITADDPAFQLIAQTESLQGKLQAHCLQQIFSIESFPLQIARTHGEYREIQLRNSYLYPVKWGKAELEWPRIGFWQSNIEVDNYEDVYLVYTGRYKFSPYNALLAVQGRDNNGHRILDLMTAFMDFHSYYPQLLNECKPGTVIDEGEYGDTYSYLDWDNVESCRLYKILKQKRAIQIESDDIYETGIDIAALQRQISDEIGSGVSQQQALYLNRIKKLKSQIRWEGWAKIFSEPNSIFDTVEYTLRWKLSANGWLALFKLIEIPWEADYSRQVSRNTNPEYREMLLRMPAPQYPPQPVCNECRRPLVDCYACQHQWCDYCGSEFCPVCEPPEESEDDDDGDW